MYKVGIVGASGYIGSVLTRNFLAREWSVVSLGRRAAHGVSEHRLVDIHEPLLDSMVDGLDAIVHLAANTGSSNDSHAAEVVFAAALAGIASERGVPLLFVSSQAASLDSPSQYGRTKAVIEAGILPMGAIVIRPGLVYGGEEKGLFGLMASFLRRTRLRPCLLPSPLVQPVHVHDLSDAIANALALNSAKGRWFGVAGRPVKFNYFLRMIAGYRLHRTTLPIPVPVVVLRRVLLFGGNFFGPKIGAERLDSLTSLSAMDCESDMNELGVSLRDERDGLSKSGKPRRRLLVEGLALGHSLVGIKRKPWMVRRYLRMLNSQNQNVALDLPVLSLRFPILLTALDCQKERSETSAVNLMGRMNMMYRLCEAGIEDASKFIATGSNSRTRAGLDLLMSGFRELQSFVLKPLARIVVRSAR